LKNTKDKIYFNFSYKALKLLGDGLYSNPWTAISELVANGIDAEATKIYININMIDKEYSSIEIFDNGYGMDYDDLAEKYALIGKNKRFDDELNEFQKNKVMGRKGIGKLSALYLSSKYYLITKNENETNCWCIDMSNITDDEIPNMKRNKTIPIESFKEWNKFNTGTLIKLVNVDLRHIGEQTIEGLKARIADYYSFENDNIKIYMSLQKDENDIISFSKVIKQIAFKNFYAFYNNTNINYDDKISKTIFLSTTIPGKIKGPKDDLFYKKFRTIKINKEFDTKGQFHFLLENGQESKQLIKYEMRGWIGCPFYYRKE
jgi:HSP90 family molecular chaperone